MSFTALNLPLVYQSAMVMVCGFSKGIVCKTHHKIKLSFVHMLSCQYSVQPNEVQDQLVLFHVTCYHRRKFDIVTR